MVQCKSFFGSDTVDYWEGDKWVDLTRVDDSLNELNKMLNFVFLVNEEDSLIWNFNPNGLFFVSSLYGYTFEDYHEPHWAKAWFKGLSPKVNIIFWILLEDKILITDNLKNKGLSLVSRCYLCKQLEESVNHFTIHCSYTRNL